MKKYSLFTKGMASGYKGPGGWAFLILDSSDTILRSNSGPNPYTTINQMELIAFKQAIDVLVRDEFEPGKIELSSSSTYLLNGIFTWLEDWKKLDWNKNPKKGSHKPIEHHEIWRLIDRQIKVLNSRGFQLSKSDDEDFQSTEHYEAIRARAQSRVHQACNSTNPIPASEMINLEVNDLQLALLRSIFERWSDKKINDRTALCEIRIKSQALGC